MVMRRNRMAKNLQRSIVRSLGRYLAILAIIAMGCGIFVGLKVTKTDMVQTGQEYTQSQNFFDLRLVNSYGWTKTELDAVANLDGVVDAEGSVYLDAFVSVDDDAQHIFRIHAMPKTINRPYLLTGRLPLEVDECLVDGAYFSEADIGREITVVEGNLTDTLDSLTERTFTIVGCVSSPLYMNTDASRGTTSLGSGSISAYIYVPQEAICVDYYTEIYVTMDVEGPIYTTEHTLTKVFQLTRTLLFLTNLSLNSYSNVS